MKLKKLKKLIKAINELAKRPASDIGIIKTGYMLDNNHPLVLLPTTGKYVLPEVQIIDKIIRSLEPKEIITQSLKVNAQSGMQIMSVFRDNLKKDRIILLIHTPKGCIPYRVECEEGFESPSKQSNIITISDDMLEKLQK